MERLEKVIICHMSLDFWVPNCRTNYVLASMTLHGKPLEGIALWGGPKCWVLSSLSMMKWKQSYYITIYQDLHTHDMVRGNKTLHCIIYHKNGNMTYDWESQNGLVVAQPDLKSDTYFNIHACSNCCCKCTITNVCTCTWWTLGPAASAEWSMYTRDWCGLWIF